MSKTTKPRKRATIIVKRQYGGSLDIEKAFTEVLIRALIKIPKPQPKDSCLPQNPA